MFTAALFKIAKVWEQPVFPSELMAKENICIHNRLLFSFVVFCFVFLKKEGNPVIFRQHG